MMEIENMPVGGPARWEDTRWSQCSWQTVVGDEAQPPHVQSLSKLDKTGKSSDQKTQHLTRNTNTLFQTLEHQRATPNSATPVIQHTDNPILSNRCDNPRFRLCLKGCVSQGVRCSVSGPARWCPPLVTTCIHRSSSRHTNMDVRAHSANAAASARWGLQRVTDPLKVH